MLRYSAQVTQDEIVRLVRGLPGTVVQTADEASGAPAAAWGDSFVFYDPDDREENRRLGFATIVTKDYVGFDEASDLNRPGVFRLNLAVGAEQFEAELGYPPAQHAPARRRSTTRCSTSSFPTRSTPVRAGLRSSARPSGLPSRFLLEHAYHRAAARHRSQA